MNETEGIRLLNSKIFFQTSEVKPLPVLGTSSRIVKLLVSQTNWEARHVALNATNLTILIEIW
jgi:hypothetical protein